MANDIGVIRDQIRLLVDPLLIRFRQELYGSGVSFGTITPSALPSTIVYQTDISTIETNVTNSVIDYIDSQNYITDPMTSIGDMVYHNASNILARFPITTTSGYVIAMSDGLPAWMPVTYLKVPRNIAWYQDTVASGDAQGPLRRIDVNCTLNSCYIYVKTAPVGSAIIIDIKKASAPDGTFTTIFTATPQIAATTYVGSSMSFSPVTLNSGEYLRMDITQVGSTSTGAGLTVDLNLTTR